jgi:hypothetical protein
MCVTVLLAVAHGASAERTLTHNHHYWLYFSSTSECSTANFAKALSPYVSFFMSVYTTVQYSTYSILVISYYFEGNTRK